MWAKILDEIDRRGSGFDWRILILQFISQCGSVYVYPAVYSQAERQYFPTPVSLELVVDDWAKQYNNLPDGSDEDLFEKSYNRMFKKWVSVAKAGISADSRLKERFLTLKKRKDFAVFYVDEGSFVDDQMEFLWGNRPPKRNFKSAKELFEHTLRKADLTPKYSMRFRGDELYAVHWFGHAFTDKFVDLIEEVPNVSVLCSELEELYLVATKISSAGVERLKVLLPKTNFIVVSDEEDADGCDPWYQ